jgi:hypothetical protein
MKDCNFYIKYFSTEILYFAHEGPDTPDAIRQRDAIF